jgi:predicted  nucleic acid-binding Zn-ribbon protein
VRDRRQSEQRAREAEARAKEMEERMSTLQREVSEQQLRLAARERDLTEQMTSVTQQLQQLADELEARDRQMADRDRHIVELRAHIDRLSEQQVEAPPLMDAPAASVAVSEEVRRLLKAAEDSAASIVENARLVGARNTAEAERQWRELQTSLTRFAGWRERVGPQLVDLHARMEELRSRISEIPDRVRAAFAPLAEASAATEAGLLGLTDDLTPPLLSAPSPSDVETAPANVADHGATGARGIEDVEGGDPEGGSRSSVQ